MKSSYIKSHKTKWIKCSLTHFAVASVSSHRRRFAPSPFCAASAAPAARDERPSCPDGNWLPPHGGRSAGVSGRRFVAWAVCSAVAVAGKRSRLCYPERCRTMRRWRMLVRWRPSGHGRLRPSGGCWKWKKLDLV